MTELCDMTCKACEGGVAPMTQADAKQLLSQTPGWEMNVQANEIMRTFEFKNYYRTIAFVNAIAWMSHRENHHPDLEVGYNLCKIRYQTHAIGGLSENDFICAAKVNEIHKQGPA